MRAPLLYTLALCASGFIGAAPAGAHDSLTITNPSAGQRVVTPPPAIHLGFSGGVTTKPAAPHITVTGPQGARYETACARAAGQGVDVTWRPGPRGTYTVTWRVITSDGHPNTGHYTFTYAGTPGNVPTTSPSCDDAASKTSPRAGIMVLALAICLGSAGGVAALIYRERRPARPLGYYPDDDE